MTLPRGLQIALTRSADDNAAWAAKLRERGLVDVQIACLETRAMANQAQALRAAFAGAHALLFTSARAVRAFGELAPELSLANMPCACVAEASARAARLGGASVLFLAPAGTARSLAEEWILRQPAELRPLWLAAREARPDLAEVFQRAGRELKRLPIYQTESAAEIDSAPASTSDAIFFASPSAVAALSDPGLIPNGPRLISIGPTTSATLRKLGRRVSAEAQTRSLDGLLQALESSLQSEPLRH